MSAPATVQDRPKGVIAPAQARKTFRMQRYLPAPALAALALALGYFEQACFSADFRKLVGEAPAQYGKRARA